MRSCGSDDFGYFAGHSVSDGGIVLDLSDMRALHIDAEAHTA
jgi:FAD/FMN-containing dehydrogenase